MCFSFAVPFFGRVATAAAVAGVLVLAGTTAAEAHVRVHPDSTAAGSFSALTFRVPNESATAGTVEVSVTLPQDTPFLYVSTKPVPGWRATTTEEALPKPVDSEGTTITKAVRTVTWAAGRGTQIAPGEYQEFSLSVGPLPAAGTVLLPATQTYSDGKVVKWDEPTPASGKEPENPAPALVVTAAQASSATSAPVADQPAPAVASTGSSGSGLGVGFGVAGLVVGLAALAVALLGRRSSHPGA